LIRNGNGGTEKGPSVFSKHTRGINYKVWRQASIIYYVFRRSDLDRKGSRLLYYGTTVDDAMILPTPKRVLIENRRGRVVQQRDLCCSL